MSRGPGKQQRRMLELIEDGKWFSITNSEMTKAEQNAARRAAYRLEQMGKLQITSVVVGGLPRLTAGPVTMDLPEHRVVTGLNGKSYRMPTSRNDYA